MLTYQYSNKYINYSLSLFISHTHTQEGGKGPPMIYGRNWRNAPKLAKKGAA